jgi:cysteine desulfurase
VSDGIYADYNATTPLCEGAKAQMAHALEIWGNPSSAHRLGRKASELLEKARESVARRAETSPTELVFTSGGSEANTLAVMGSQFLCAEPFRLLTSTVEHSSIKDTANWVKSQGGTVAHVALAPNGSLDLAAFELQLQEFRPHLVSLMTANNETGILFPIPEIARLAAAHQTIFHTDAVQAFGKVPSAFWNQADLISISAHKVYGPKGAGALLVRRSRKLIPTHYGGSQEIKRRGGTENMIGIAGFGGACQEWFTDDAVADMESARDRFENRLIEKLENVAVTGAEAPRLPNTSNVRFTGVASEVLLGALDLDGVSVSAGSACSSGSVTPSHVLLALGLSVEQARECLRFSFGKDTTAGDIDTIARLVVDHVHRIRNRKNRV